MRMVRMYVTNIIIYNINNNKDLYSTIYLQLQHNEFTKSY